MTSTYPTPLQPKYLPEYGHKITREVYTETDIPYYTFVKEGSDSTKLDLGTAGSTAVGVSTPSIIDIMPDGMGGIVPRTKWRTGEIPEVQHTGVCYVQLATAVQAGQQAKVGTDGLGDLYVPPTIANPPTQQNLIDVMNAHLIIAGTYVDGGQPGDIVRVDLDRR